MDISQNGCELQCREISSAESPSVPGLFVDRFRTATFFEEGGQRFVLATFHRNPGWLFIYNVTDPNNPFLINPNSNRILINNGPNGVDLVNHPVTGRTFFAATNTGRIYAMDVNDPTNISLISFLIIQNNSQLFDVSVEGNIAALAGTQFGNARGLVLVDVTNPAAMSYITNVPFDAGGVRIRNNIAYITNFLAAELRIYNISNPAVPILLSQLPVGVFPVPVRLHPTLDIVYVQEFNLPDTYIIDVSVPTNPVLVNTIQIAGDRVPNYGSLQFVGDLMFSNSTNGFITAFDNTDPFNPVTIKEFDTGFAGETWQMAVNNDLFIYLPQIIDGAPPDMLQILQAFSTNAISITCSEDITVKVGPEAAGANVDYPDPVVNSECPATFTCSPSSGSFFSIGTTTVSCTATDIAQNTATCTFDVTIEKTPEPETKQTQTIKVPVIYDWTRITSSATVQINILPEDND